MQEQRPAYRSYQCADFRHRFLINIGRELKGDVVIPLGHIPYMWQNLVEVLNSRRGFGVSRPRGVAFAHLGLLHGREVGIDVDYQLSISHVFNDLARSTVIATTSLDILSSKEDIDIAQRRPGLTL